MLHRPTRSRIVVASQLQSRSLLPVTGRNVQGSRFSAANFAKYRGTVSEIPRNPAALLSPNILHSVASRRCCIN